MDNLFQNNDSDHYMSTVNQNTAITETLPIYVRSAYGHRVIT